MRASAPALYNQDHDLTLLATLHGAAVLLDAQPAPLVLSEVSAVTPAGVDGAGRARTLDRRQSRPASRLEPSSHSDPFARWSRGTVAHNSAREASMRGSIILVVWLLLVVLPAVAHAQDNEALRREVEQLRRQQEQYQKTIEALNERLKRLELQNAPAAAQPAPPATPPTAGTPAAPGAPAAAAPSAPPGATPVAQAPGGPPTSSPSALDLLSPRQPFSLYQQRGAGQLLFDIGVTGDFVGNLTQRNVQKAQDGTFSGRENRFFPREVELSLFGQIDPYARADVRIEAGEEAPGQDTGVSLAEATITLLALPWGTQAKLGQMRNRYGWSNVVHEHDLPWVDRPDVYRIFFGEDGLVEKGGEATWVPDFLPFYLEVLGGVFDGDNETAFGYGRLTAPLVTGRVRAFFELTDSMATASRHLGGQRRHARPAAQHAGRLRREVQVPPGRLAASAPDAGQ